MGDGTCPSCRKNFDEPRKIDMGFLGGGVAENLPAPGPQPIPTWKPVVLAILTYIAALTFAVLSGDLKIAAEGCICI